ncbi:MAG: hypothetical protein K6G48_05335 [Acholeplasmatales bacterium]|nr:hypothetical protein [Acholeplasmatales bacterium]
MIGIPYTFNGRKRIIILSYKTYIGSYDYDTYNKASLDIIEIKDLEIKGPILRKSSKESLEEMLIEGIIKIYFSKI